MKTRTPLRLSLRITWLLIIVQVFSLVYGPVLALAEMPTLPSGGNVALGNAAISQAGNQLIIDQASNRAVINWDSFSIGQGAATIFNQPGLDAAVLNRVTGTDLSEINGLLQGTGNVYLLNPNGILVGQSGVISTGGSFIGSTLDVTLDDADRWYENGGELTFTRTDGSIGSIINNGLIQAENGNVFLLADHVQNTGSILATEGQIGLIAGAGTAKLVDSTNPRIVVTPTDASLGGTGIDNAGSMEAMAAKLQAVQGNIYALAINNTGTIRATTSYTNEAGRIIIDSNEGAVEVAGTLDVSNDEGSGGTVHVLGENVELAGATIDASGRDGGGTILVGGDFQGQGDVQRAVHTTVDENTSLLADATESGDGGKVVVWADDTTDYYGAISATGGLLGGDGGMAEVSGSMLTYEGTTDLAAPLGEMGTLLLDPYNYWIGAVADRPNSRWSVIKPSTITNGLKNANFSIATGWSTSSASVQGDSDLAGNIVIDKPLVYSPTSGGGLRMYADNNLTVNARIDNQAATSNGQIKLSAGRNIVTNAALKHAGTGLIQLEADNNITVNRNIVHSGDGINSYIRLLAGNDLSVSGNVTRSGNGKNAYIELRADRDLTVTGDISHLSTRTGSDIFIGVGYPPHVSRNLYVTGSVTHQGGGSVFFNASNDMTTGKITTTGLASLWAGGDLSIQGAIDPVLVAINVGGNVTQAMTGPITAANLGIIAGGNVGLSGPNLVDTLAVDAGGSVEFVNSKDLTIGYIDGSGTILGGIVDGITASGPVTVRSTGNLALGTLSQPSGISVNGAGNITLSTTRSYLSGSTSIYPQAGNITTYGPIMHSGAGNIELNAWARAESAPNNTAAGINTYAYGGNIEINAPIEHSGATGDILLRADAEAYNNRSVYYGSGWDTTRAYAGSITVRDSISSSATGVITLDVAPLGKNTGYGQHYTYSHGGSLDIEAPLVHTGTGSINLLADGQADSRPTYYYDYPYDYPRAYGGSITTTADGTISHFGSGSILLDTLPSAGGSGYYISASSYAGPITTGGDISHSGSGSIRAYASGLTTDGAITHSGDGDYSHISLNNYDGDLTTNGAITHSGNGDYSYIQLYNYNGDLTTDGAITHSGDGDNSYISLYNYYGDLTTNGAITHSGNGNYSYIYLDNYSGDLTTNGAITHSGNGNHSYIYLDNYSGDLTTNGAITHSGDGGYSYIYLYNHHGDLTTNGAITHSGGGEYSYIYLNNSNGDLTTNGAITHSGDGDYSYIYLYNYNGDFTANGAITHSGGGEYSDIRLHNYNGDLTTGKITTDGVVWLTVLDGNLNIAGAIDPSLVAINVSGNVDGIGTVTADELGIIAGGDVTLEGLNLVDTLAVDAGGAVTFVNDKTLTVGSVDGTGTTLGRIVEGITAGGSVNITTNNGDLAVGTIAQSGSIFTDGSEPNTKIHLISKQGDITLDGTIENAGDGDGAWIRLHSWNGDITTNGDIVYSGSGSGSEVGLLALNTITASGNITNQGPGGIAGFAFAQTVNATGAVVQADQLVLLDCGDVWLGNPNNNANVLAARVTGGLHYVDADSLTIGSAYGIDGITAGGTVDVSTVTGALIVGSGGVAVQGNAWFTDLKLAAAGDLSIEGDITHSGNGLRSSITLDAGTDLLVNGDITHSGNGLRSSITLDAGTGLQVNGDITHSGSGLLSSILLDAGTDLLVNGDITHSGNGILSSITLNAGNDLQANGNITHSGNGFLSSIRLNAGRDIILESLLQSLTGDVSLVADAVEQPGGGDGVGGVWIRTDGEADGQVIAAGNITIAGSDVWHTTTNATEPVQVIVPSATEIDSIRIDAGPSGRAQVAAGGNITLESNPEPPLADIIVGGVVRSTGGNIDINANDQIRLAAKLATDGGNITLHDAVWLGKNVTIVSKGGDIDFASTVDGNRRLKLNSGTGDIYLRGDVGTGTPLVSLTTLGSGTAYLGGNVTANGNTQTYNTPVALMTDVTLTELAGGDIVFNSTVDSDGFGPWDLSLNTSGATIFNGAVGGAAPLAILQTDVPGTTQINGGSVTTTMGQFYKDDVTLGADTVLTAGGNVSFGQTLNGPYTLRVNSPGYTRFSGPVGTVTPLVRINTDPAGETRLNGGTVITTTGQFYSDDVILGADTVLTAGGNVSFGQTLNGPYTLRVNSPGYTRFSGPVGAVTPLVRINTDPAGETRLNGGTVITTTGQFYSDDVILGADTVLTAGGNVSFGQTLNGPYTLRVNSPGYTRFSGPVGTVTPLVRINTDPAGETRLNGGAVITTTGQFYGDDVILGADTILTAQGIGGAGNVRFGQTLNGAYMLSINSPGDTIFHGSVGDMAPLVSIETDAAGRTILVGIDTVTSGSQVYNDPVLVAGDSTINADGVFFGSTVDAFGSVADIYTEDQSIALSFEDISDTGALLGVSDSDDSVELNVPIGFDFQYFDETSDVAFVSSNGFLTVVYNSYSGCCTGQPLPESSYADGIIAGWWEDLDPGDGQGDIYVQTLGAVGDRRFIVQFDNVEHWSSGNPSTFQVKLFESSGAVEFHYLGLATDGDTHSVGIESPDNTFGIQSYLGSGIPAFNAVRYSPSIASSSLGDGTSALVINSPTTQFNGNVGSTQALDSLTVNSPTAINMEAGAYTTTGNQEFNGPAILGQDATVRATSPTGATVTFNDISGNAHDLRIETADAGAISLEGTVANVDNLHATSGTIDMYETVTVNHRTTLDAESAATQHPGSSLSTDTLLLLGDGSFLLNQPGNEINVVAGDVGGSVALANSQTLVIGSVGGTDGLQSSGGDISVEATDLAVNEPVLSPGDISLTATDGQASIDANVEAGGDAQVIAKKQVTVTSDGRVAGENVLVKSNKRGVEIAGTVDANALATITGKRNVVIQESGDVEGQEVIVESRKRDVTVDGDIRGWDSVEVTAQQNLKTGLHSFILSFGDVTLTSKTGDAVIEGEVYGDGQNGIAITAQQGSVHVLAGWVQSVLADVHINAKQDVLLRGTDDYSAFVASQFGTTTVIAGNDVIVIADGNDARIGYPGMALGWGDEEWFQSHATGDIYVEAGHDVMLQAINEQVVAAIGHTGMEPEFPSWLAEELGFDEQEIPSGLSGNIEVIAGNDFAMDATNGGRTIVGHEQAEQFLIPAVVTSEGEGDGFPRFETQPLPISGDITIVAGHGFQMAADGNSESLVGHQGDQVLSGDIVIAFDNDSASQGLYGDGMFAMTPNTRIGVADVEDLYGRVAIFGTTAHKMAGWWISNLDIADSAVISGIAYDSTIPWWGGVLSAATNTWKAHYPFFEWKHERYGWALADVLASDLPYVGPFTFFYHGPGLDPNAWGEAWRNFAHDAFERIPWNILKNGRYEAAYGSPDERPEEEITGSSSYETYP